MSILRRRVAGMALPFSLVGAIACSGGHTQAKSPANAVAAQPGSPPPAAALLSSARAPKGATGERPSDEADGDDAELVVGRDVVARCTTLRLVRQHIGAFDPDMIWLAVLESIADCMSQGGPMAQQAIGVSGDEEHRHVVREVLATRGVAPTRVIAKVAQGAAECQGGTNCSKRVEITIVAP